MCRSETTKSSSNSRSWSCTWYLPAQAITLLRIVLRLERFGLAAPGGYARGVDGFPAAASVARPRLVRGGSPRASRGLAPTRTVGYAAKCKGLGRVRYTRAHRLFDCGRAKVWIDGHWVGLPVGEILISYAKADPERARVVKGTIPPALPAELSRGSLPALAAGLSSGP